LSPGVKATLGNITRHCQKERKREGGRKGGKERKKRKGGQYPNGLMIILGNSSICIFLDSVILAKYLLHNSQRKDGKLLCN
jgi:hypothetical protein